MLIEVSVFKGRIACVPAWVQKTHKAACCQHTITCNLYPSMSFNNLELKICKVKEINWWSIPSISKHNLL